MGRGGRTLEDLEVPMSRVSRVVERPEDEVPPEELWVVSPVVV